MVKRVVESSFSYPDKQPEMEALMQIQSVVLNGFSDLCLFGALQGSSGVMVHKTPEDKSESCSLKLPGQLSVLCKRPLKDIRSLKSFIYDKQHSETGD